MLKIVENIRELLRVHLGVCQVTRILGNLSFISVIFDLSIKSSSSSSIYAFIGV